MKVTDITEQKKITGRVNLFIDGAYYCSIAARLIEERRVYIGMEVSAEELDRIIFESDRQKAFDYACAYVGKHPSTVKAVKEKLFNRGYGKAVVEHVIAKMSDYGFLDDRSFALDYFDAKKGSVGTKKIAMNLRLKGVSEEDIAAIYEQEDKEEMLKSALRVTKRHMGEKFPDEKYLARLHRFLASRGYDYDIIAKCISYAKGGEDESFD